MFYILHRSQLSLNRKSDLCLNKKPDYYFVIEVMKLYGITVVCVLRDDLSNCDGSRTIING